VGPRAGMDMMAKRKVPTSSFRLAVGLLNDSYSNSKDKVVSVLLF
jgi:hypothetical protein